MIGRHASISRRAFTFGLVSVVSCLPGICSADSWDHLPPWHSWKFIPSVVVVSDSDDQRIPAVHDAVRFWNDVFLDLGSPFRLGSVAHIAAGAVVDQIRWNNRAESALDWLMRLPEPPPDEDARARSNRLFGVGVFSFFEQVTKGQGDLIVALSDGARSFTRHSQSPRKTLVVVEKFPTYQTNPPTMLNGAQDTIAHELGHAIGLGHNSDRTSLMCNPCRFAERDGFGPLLDSEKALLRKMYPPSWREGAR